jgi:hypothetical protein
MATLIPSLGAARFDARGELRLAERLKDFLEDNAVVWHNLPVGPRGRHPDFVLIHPDHRLLVLEVKDWRLDNVLSATKTEIELLTDRGPVREQSPFEQVRGYMYDVVRMLERDPQLVFPPEHPFKSKPIVPCRLRRRGAYGGRVAAGSPHGGLHVAADGGAVPGARSITSAIAWPRPVRGWALRWTWPRSIATALR